MDSLPEKLANLRKKEVCPFYSSSGMFLMLNSLFSEKLYIEDILYCFLIMKKYKIDLVRLIIIIKKYRFL